MNPQTGQTAFAAISLMMFVSGLGIPVMAAMNSGLGRHLASPAAATATLFGVGFIAAAAVAIMAGLPPLASFRSAPLPNYCPALLMVFYVLAVTFAAPRIGLANAIFFVLLGQVIAAATIDHFALLGAARTMLTLRRAFGIMVMAVGLYFARRQG